jgi:dienelactone hydrolase
MVHNFEEALKEADKKVEAIKTYKAGHGFMRPTNGPDKKNPVYREEEANDAWKQIEAFFAKGLAEK